MSALPGAACTVSSTRPGAPDFPYLTSCRVSRWPARRTTTSSSTRSPGSAAVKSICNEKSRGRRCCDQKSSPPTSAARNTRRVASRLVILLVFGLLLRAHFRLDPRLARGLELDGRVDFQRHAGQELPDLAPQRLALEESPHLLRHDPCHLGPRLVGLREEERQRVLGQLHVGDHVADALFGHEESAHAGQHRPPHDVRHQPGQLFRLLVRKLILLVHHGPPRCSVKVTLGSLELCPWPFTATTLTCTCCPCDILSSVMSSSICSVPFFVPVAMPCAANMSESDTVCCVPPLTRKSSTPLSSVPVSSRKSTASSTFNGSSTSWHRAGSRQRRLDNCGPPP